MHESRRLTVRTDIVCQLQFADGLMAVISDCVRTLFVKFKVNRTPTSILENKNMHAGFEFPV
jgi:hypothetical protein